MKIMVTFWMIESSDDNPTGNIPEVGSAVPRRWHQTQSTEGQCSYGPAALSSEKIVSWKFVYAC